MEDSYPNVLYFSYGTDMSSLQKTAKRGEAMKNMLYACYCCNIHRDDLVQLNLLPSADCEALSRGLPCYHQQVTDQQLLIQLKNEQSEVEREWLHLRLLPLAGTRICFGDTGVNNSADYPLHIEFQGRSVTTKQQHLRLLERESWLYEMYCLLVT